MSNDMEMPDNTICSCCKRREINESSPVVCQHLVDLANEVQGYFTNGEEQAWCQKCETMWTETGGTLGFKTPEFKVFSSPTNVCKKCFMLIRVKHKASK